MMSPKAFLRLIIESLIAWNRINALRHAAALAFFTIFSLAPLVALTVGIVSTVFQQASIEAQIVNIAERYMGEQVAAIVAEVLQNREAGFTRPGAWVPLISLGVTIFGASYVFRELQSSLDVMWGLVSQPITPETRNLWRNLFIVIQKYLITAAVALSVGFLLIALLLISALGTTLMQWTMPVQLLDPLVSVIVHLLRFVGVPLLLAGIFATMFKVLPQATIRWRDVWPGAALTAILFWLGGYGIGIYLSLSSLSSTYGAASTLTLFLIWVFISTSIVLYGAKFTQLYAGRYGVPIQPQAGTVLNPEPPMPELTWLSWLE